MKIIGILNELYNNNKLENKRFKTPDGTILNNTEALLDYVGVSDNEWYSLTDLIETLQSEVEVLEEVEDKEYEDIEVYDYVDNYEVMYPNTIANNFVHLNEDLQTITKAIKYILERLDKNDK